jgi:RNA polymerase sigma factor (sigma-70 family)
MATSDEGWEDFDVFRDQSLALRERRVAFERLVAKKWKYVNNAARTVLYEVCDGKPPRGADPEQMAVDAFHVLGMKRDEVDNPHSFLWGALRMFAHRFKESANKLADNRALTYERLLPHHFQQDPESEEEILQERQRVSVAIGKLTKNHQQVIELHDYDGLTFKEIDQFLGLKTGGARQRHCRARVRLAELLREDFHPTKPAPRSARTPKTPLD